MEKSNKVLKIVLFIAILCLAILFLGQTKVNAKTTNVTTIEELKTAFKERVTIDGNAIKLTDNVTLEDALYIKIPELIIDFNGKTIEENGILVFYNKVTFKDSSTTNRLNWGKIVFNANSIPGSISINENAELIINNGKFVDGEANSTNSSLINVAGKLVINDAIFSSATNKPVYNKNGSSMISLGLNGKCVINSGDFNYDETLIMCGSPINSEDYKYFNNCKLTINGGNFNCVEEGAIKIYTCYPYYNNREVIVPKITLNNCNIKAKDSVISFYGGCTEEEFKNTDTKILTILGGKYICSEQSSGSPIEIVTSFSNTYFNPNDLVLEGGTFESLNNSKGAISLIGPIKGEYKTVCDGLLYGYSGKIYGNNEIGTERDYSYTMQKVIIENGKVISATGELKGLKVIADLSESNNGNSDKVTTKTDSKTNIKLEATKGIIPDNTTMNIVEITSGATFEKIKNNLELEEFKNFKAFDITLKSNNTNIQPKGKVKISIPIPTGFDDSRVVIYRLEEDGSKTEYQVKVANRYATFETEHFSTYILGEKEKAANEMQDKTDKNGGKITTEKNDTKLPKTGEETNTFVTWLSIVIVLGTFWIASMLLIDHEKKKMTKK